MDTKKKLKQEQPAAETSAVSRRGFLGMSGTAVAAAGLSAIGGTALAAESELGLESRDGGSGSGQRRSEAFRVRKDAAQAQKQRPQPPHGDNGDDRRYSDRRGSFSKTLPHSALGEVDPAAYLTYLAALDSGDSDIFAAIPAGGTAKLVNPQSAYSFEMLGPDSHHLGILVPPAFRSAWEAGEMVEVYWHALTRDVHFNDFGSDGDIAAAVADLNSMSDFRGPKDAGQVTTGTIFRGQTPGDLVGPYVSQFLYKPVPFGYLTIEQKYKPYTAGSDRMTSYPVWLNVQRGVANDAPVPFDATGRFAINQRDIARIVHDDFTYQIFMNAALILLGFGGAALSDLNPYKSNTREAAFATLGGPQILDLVAAAANRGLKAAWYQKWLVHRRLRPEVYAGRVHNHKTGAKSYDLHADVLGSDAAAETFGRFGTYLLPMAYAEGSPAHPAYPAGHATIAGACVTILKAFFKESFAIPSPVQPNFDGSAIGPYAGALTVGGELNKLANNVSIGRNMAGVHWRTDGEEGMNLGEELAIGMLRDYLHTYNEAGFQGFELTRFNGQQVTLTP